MVKQGPSSQGRRTSVSPYRWEPLYFVADEISGVASPNFSPEICPGTTPVATVRACAPFSPAPCSTPVGEHKEQGHGIPGCGMGRRFS